MKSNTISKINKLGKAGYVICKISKIVLMISVVVGLVCAILMCVVPREAVKIELSTVNSAVIYVDENLDYPKVFDLDMEGSFEIGQNTYPIITDETAEVEAVKTVFMLSFIFKYGVGLQTEADETL